MEMLFGVGNGGRNMKTLVFDIDGTICSQEAPHNYQHAIPKQNVIDRINEHYNDGDTIIFETSRHMLHWKTTENWLRKHNVNYHLIFYGKPVGDYYIDKKNLSIEQFMGDELDD